MRELSLVAASGGHSSSRCAGLSLSRPFLLQSTGSRRAGSVVVAHGLSCSAACGIFPDQGLNPCPLHWQADSQPLRHQGSPKKIFKEKNNNADNKVYGKKIFFAWEFKLASLIRGRQYDAQWKAASCMDEIVIVKIQINKKDLVLKLWNSKEKRSYRITQKKPQHISWVWHKLGRV